jgi:hypothetical protein
MDRIQAEEKLMSLIQVNADNIKDMVYTATENMELAEKLENTALLNNLPPVRPGRFK